MAWLGKLYVLPVYQLQLLVAALGATVLVLALW